MKTYALIKTLVIVFLLYQVINVIGSSVSLIGNLNYDWPHMVNPTAWAIFSICLSILFIRIAIIHSDRLLGFFNIYPIENDVKIDIPSSAKTVTYIAITLGLFFIISNAVDFIFELVGLIKEGNLRGTGIDGMLGQRRNYSIESLVYFGINLLIGIGLILFSTKIGNSIQKKYIATIE